MLELPSRSSPHRVRAARVGVPATYASSARASLASPHGTRWAATRTPAVSSAQPTTPLRASLLLLLPMGIGQEDGWMGAGRRRRQIRARTHLLPVGRGPDDGGHGGLPGDVRGFVGHGVRRRQGRPGATRCADHARRGPTADGPAAGLECFRIHDVVLDPHLQALSIRMEHI